MRVRLHGEKKSKVSLLKEQSETSEIRNLLATKFCIIEEKLQRLQPLLAVTIKSGVKTSCQLNRHTFLCL